MRKIILSILMVVALMMVLAIYIANRDINDTPHITVALGETESSLESAIVARVIDGDTIVLDNGERVRLIGVDSPEMGERGADEGAQPGAIEAKQFVSELVLGQTVWLESEGRDRDRFERLRRYVWLELPDDTDSVDEIRNKMLNAMLIAEGHAVTMIINPGEVRHEALFRGLEG
jgi:micrococcal nuclease